ncbi:hypothetical protein GCM10027020_13730 [Nocardioides salsibiostraticola]
MTLETDLQSLTSDAAVWDDSSDTLANAVGTINELVLTTSQLSWAAEVTGLTAEYAAFVSRAAELVNQGRLETASMAVGLRQVRDGYEDSDTDSREELAGLWDFTP